MTSKTVASSCPYSPKYLEEEFCELRIDGVLRSSPIGCSRKFEFQAVTEEFLDAGERVVVLGHFRVRGKATGKTIDAPFAHVWTLREGKAVYHHNYVDTATILQSLG